MPEQRLQRTRDLLPDGYQFGDMAHGHRVLLLEPDEWVPRLSANVAVVTKQRGEDRGDFAIGAPGNPQLPQRFRVRR